MTGTPGTGKRAGPFVDDLSRRRYRSGAVGRLVGTTLTVLLWVATGCALKTSSLQILDYREPGAPKRYRESFNEAYYDIDGEGNVEIALRRTAPGEADPHGTITQVVHIRSIWRSIPGRTVAHRSQINATVTYCITDGRTGAMFEGAGSVFFRQSRGRNRLTGALELATLRPKRRLTAGGRLFERAEVAGEFHAIRNPRRVRRIINDMNRLFGPLSRNGE